MVKVYAPASSANMSVGFDVLGAAVTPVDGTLLGDNVTVEAAEQFSLAESWTLRQQTADGAAGEHCLPVLGKLLPGDRQDGAGGDDAGKKHADWLRAGFQRLARWSLRWWP